MDAQVGGHVGVHVAEAVERAQAQVEQKSAKYREMTGQPPLFHRARHHQEGGGGGRMGFELSSESNKFEQARTLLAFLKRRKSLETSVDTHAEEPEWLIPDSTLRHGRVKEDQFEVKYIKKLQQDL
jgi:hypothetical protein